MTYIFDYILRLIFPPKCICCNKLLGLKSKIPFCDSCNQKLKEWEYKSAKDYRTNDIENGYALYFYDSQEVKGIIHHVKTSFSKQFADYFEIEMKKFLTSKNLYGKIDIVAYPPRRKSEISIEGIDQAKLMAEVIARAINADASPCLKRVGKSSKQRELSKEERALNVKNKFEVIKDIKGKTILIVDDVVTTGATVKECARVLKSQGAVKIYVFSISSKN